MSRAQHSAEHRNPKQSTVPGPSSRWWPRPTDFGLTTDRVDRRGRQQAQHQPTPGHARGSPPPGEGEGRRAEVEVHDVEVQTIEEVEVLKVEDWELWDRQSEVRGDVVSGT